MLPYVRRPWLAGLIVAVPIALVAAAYAAAFLGPNARFAVDLGEARTAAFGAAALLAALALAGWIAHEDLGTFSGLLAYWALGQTLAVILAAVEEMLLGGFAEADAVLVFLVSAIVSLGATLLLWVSAGVIWVAAVRRLTIPGLRGSTELELAGSEAARDSAVREQVRFDSANPGGHVSKLRRNRD